MKYMAIVINDKLILVQYHREKTGKREKLLLNK